MKKIFISILILSLLISGCTHTISKYSNEYEIDFYNRIEKMCEKKDELTIETINKEKYKAKELKITVDTTSFIENKKNLLIIKKTQEISSISFTPMYRGAFEGFLYGSLIGGGAGLLVQLKEAGVGSPKGDVYFILYSALTGAAVGTIYGLINPGRVIIKIN